jgi:hypothetical protein
MTDLIDEASKQFPTRDSFGSQEITSLVGVVVGDQFMRCEQVGWSGHRYVRVSCERKTAKQAVIGGVKYWIEDARRVGDYYGGKLMLVDIAKLQESEKAERMRKFRRELSGTDWDKIEDHTVIAAVHLLRGK